MEKCVKSQDRQPKKTYSAPALTTHGDAAKLTQFFPINPIVPGSGILTPR